MYRIRTLSRNASPDHWQKVDRTLPAFACLVRETPETLLTRIFTSLPGKTTQRHRNASRAPSPETVERLRLEYRRMKAEPMRSCSAQLYGTGGHSAPAAACGGRGRAERGRGEEADIKTGNKPCACGSFGHRRRRKHASQPASQPASDPAKAARKAGIPIQKDKNQQGTIGFSRPSV